MDELFLRFGDLPLHPLAVHFAVVLLPLSALVFIVAVCWPKFRSKFLVSSLVGLGVSLPAVFVASRFDDGAFDWHVFGCSRLLACSEEGFGQADCLRT